MTRLVHNEKHLTLLALPWQGGHPIITWLDSIDQTTRGQFRALTRMMDKAYLLDFAYEGRVMSIPGSQVGLIRMRVTPPGDPAPQHVVYAIQRDTYVLMACGGFPCSDSEQLAEVIVAAWQGTADGNGEKEAAA